MSAEITFITVTMLRNKIILALLACCCASSVTSSENSYLRVWSITPSNTTFLHPGTLFATDAYTYPMAECEITDPKTERVCDVALVTSGREDRVCENIKIFADKGKILFFNGFFQITPFTRNHVALGWYTQPDGPETEPKLNNNIQVTLVNMDKCTSAYLSFPIDGVKYGFFPAVVYYDNQVDIILNSKESCKGETKCKLTFDLDGKQIGGVQSYQPNVLQYASPVSEKDPSKGIFVHSQDLKSLTVLLVDKDGKEKQLSVVNFEPEASEEDRLLAFSNAHEVYSICRMHKADSKPTSIDCAQYDSNGQTKANASIPLEKSANWLEVRSLASGDILVATSGADEKKPNSFRVYKIHGNEAPKHIDLTGPGFKCKDKDNGLEIRISENERKNICFDFSCLQGTNDLKYKSQCVSNDVLSEKL